MQNINARVVRIIHDVPRVPLYAIFWIFYGASFLFPRSKRIWIFDEWQGMRFADNARYLFLYIHEHRKDICAVWISRSYPLIAELRANGFRAYHARSLLGLWYTLRAKVIVFESSMSVFFWLTGNIKKINLWHGLPIKKIVYDSARTKAHNWALTATGMRRRYHTFFHPEKVMLGDYVLAQSKEWKAFFSSAFRVRPERVIVENQPRNVAMIASKIFLLADERRFVDEVKSRTSKKIITYLPTFRDGSHNPLDGSGIDFEELDALLGAIHMHMYIKMHHERSVSAAGAQLENISFLPVELGAMVILRHTDVLLTDYSSVYFEFLLSDRPILFFPFDIEKYRGTLRDMYFEYDSITPGPKAFTFVELKGEIRKVAEGTDAFASERARIREMSLSPEVENAPEKTCRVIEDILTR